MGGKGLEVDKFNRRNSVGLWQIKVRALLKREGIWSPLMKNPPAPVPENWDSLEENAHSTLLFSLEDEIITKVSEQEIAAGLWAKLETMEIHGRVARKDLGLGVGVGVGAGVGLGLGGGGGGSGSGAGAGAGSGSSGSSSSSSSASSSSSHSGSGGGGGSHAGSSAGSYAGSRAGSGGHE